MCGANRMARASNSERPGVPRYIGGTSNVRAESARWTLDYRELFPVFILSRQSIGLLVIVVLLPTSNRGLSQAVIKDSFKRS